jgi:hypothetical protein
LKVRKSAEQGETAAVVWFELVKYGYSKWEDSIPAVGHSLISPYIDLASPEIWNPHFVWVVQPSEVVVEASWAWCQLHHQTWAYLELPPT